MFKRWLANLILVLVLLGGLYLIVRFSIAYYVHSKSPRIANTPVMLTQVQTLSQLVTVKYVMEKVVMLEDTSHWYELSFGESRVLMIAHGIVKAGVNLEELKPGDLQVSGKRITIQLPPARITDTYLDDNLTQIIDRKTGLLRSFDKDLEQNARRQAVADINRAARNGGILSDADERARSQLILFFHGLGFDEVQISLPLKIKPG